MLQQKSTRIYRAKGWKNYKSWRFKIKEKKYQVSNRTEKKGKIESLKSGWKNS